MEDPGLARLVLVAKVWIPPYGQGGLVGLPRSPDGSPTARVEVGRLEPPLEGSWWLETGTVHKQEIQFTMALNASLPLLPPLPAIPPAPPFSAPLSPTLPPAVYPRDGFGEALMKAFAVDVGRGYP